MSESDRPSPNAAPTPEAEPTTGNARGIDALTAILRGRMSPTTTLAVAVIALAVAFTQLATSNPPPAGIYLYGVLVGALYALGAMGFVLVYRANRIINFAQANLGAAPAVAALLLFARRDWPYLVCLPLAIVSAGALGAFVELAVIRRFLRRPRLTLTVATIGLAQILLFVEIFTPRWVGGQVGSLDDAIRFETPLTRFDTELGGVVFTGDHLLTLVVVLGIAAALGAFFRYSSIGVAIRASAENADRASLLGVPVRRLSTIVWVLAAAMSAAGVFLRVPMVGSLPTGGLAGESTLLFMVAPAVIARMQSLPQAFAAGIGIGVLGQVIFYVTRDATLSSAAMLPVILVGLLLQRNRMARAADTGVSTWQQVKEFRPVPRELLHVPQVMVVRLASRVVMIGLLIAAPFIVGEFRRDLASLLVVYAITAVSLVILAGWAGQISLGHFAFVAVGAAVAGGLGADADVGFIPAVTAGGLVGAAIAIAIGLPALRLPGLFLGVTTLAFAVNTQSYFLNRKYFGWVLPEEGNPVPRPILGGRLDLRGDLAYYYLCLFVLGAVVLCAQSLRRHRSGRVFLAARDNPRAAQSFGIGLAGTRLAAFALSGFFAAVAGGLLAHLHGAVDAAVYSPSRSLQIFSMTVLGGLTSIPGAIAGATYVVVFQYVLPDYALLGTGAGMLLVLLLFPGGLAEVGFQLRDAFLRRVAIKHGILVPSLLADSGGNAPDALDHVTLLLTKEENSRVQTDDDVRDSGGKTHARPTVR